jgi:iron complex outermembrane receptor protein
LQQYCINKLAKKFILNLFYYRVALLVLLIIIIIPTKNRAQCESVLKGKLTDAHTKEVIPFATITIKEGSTQVKSDSIGNFIIYDLCNQKYSIEVVSLNNVKSTFNVYILGDTIMNFLCNATHITQLETVTIREGNELTEESPLIIKLNYDQIEQNQGQSLAELLSATSEASMLKTGSNISKPVINGMHGNRLLLFNNEIRLEGQQWGQEHAPELDTYLANSITLVKGAATLQYGHDAMAGVILLQSKPLYRITKPIEGQVSTSFFSNGRGASTALLLEGKSKTLEGFYWRTQGSIKKTGDLHSPTYFIQNTGVEEYNFALTTGYFKSKWGIELFYSQFNSEIGIFKGSHIGNLTDLLDVLNTDRNDESLPFSYTIDRPKQHIEHELFKVKTNYYLKPNQTLSLLLGRQYNLRAEYDLHIPRIDSLAALNSPQLQYELVTYSSDLSYKFKHKFGSHQLGVQANNMTNVYDGRYFIPNYIQNTIGFYVVEQLAFKKWNFAVSGRYDYKDLTSYFWQNNEIVSPNRVFQNAAYAAEAAYKPNEKFTFFVNLSNSWRAPSVNELYSTGLHHGTASFEKGNDQLTFEQQYQSAFGIHYSNKNTRISFAPFASIINDYIYLTPTLLPVLTIQGAFPAFEYKQVDVLYSGATATVNQKFLNEKWNLTIRGTMLRVFERESKSFIFGIPANNVTSKITYNLNEKSSDTTKKFRNNSISAQWLFVAQQTKVNPLYDYSPPPPAYHLFSIHYATQLQIKNQTMTFYLGIENLFNTEYKDYMNRLRYFSNEMGRNISLRINYKF